MWRLFIVIFSTAIVCCSAEIGSYDYDNKIEDNIPNDRDNLTSNVYVLPEQIFNDGKPFYVKKDSSGSIDFNAKTTPESLPTPTDAVSTQTTTLSNGTTANQQNGTVKHDISLDNNVRTQNIHDFLNLPVKYQSSKFVYPLVSSSYANLKYQGSNKNYVSNHKLDHKLDSSTVKSVAYTTKKYKSTYPTKSYSTASASRTSTTTESYDSSTKATSSTTNSTRKYASIPSRTSTPGRRYSTVSRVSSTTVRNSLPNAEVKFTRGRSTTTTTTTSKPIESFESSFVTPIPIANASSSTVAPEYTNKSTTDDKKDTDGMGLSDIFWNLWNGENDETEATKATPSTTVMTLRPTLSTTHAPHVTNDYERTKPYTNRYNITMNSATRKPINRTITPELSTSTIRTTEPTGDQFLSASTASSLIVDYGDKTTLNAGKFRPPTHVNNIRVSPGSNTATLVTNGQVSTAAGGFGIVHPFNEPNPYKGQFQPPSQSHMNNIVVLPDSNSASFVATGQLQTTTRFDQKPVPQSDNGRRPISNPNTIDETTKPGITFISKGQVTSAEAYDNPNQNNNVFFHGPSSSNSNSILIAPGMQTASFVTTSQMSLGGEKPHDQHKNIENEINVYGSGLQSTQRPHGFLLPSTTSIPKPVNTVLAESADGENETQHVRFPNENSENAEKLIASPSVQTPEATTNNTIKFPANQVPQGVLQIPQAPVAPVNEGLVKFTDTHNEIADGLIDPNNYKQIIQTPSLPAAGSFVVFRPQPAIAVPQPPPQLMMGMALPQMIRQTPFVFAKKPPTYVHFPRKNYTLPNILPQFRPTQSVVQPQQQISLSPEIANQLRQGQINRAPYLYNAQNLRFKVPFMPTYSQRPMQIRPSIDQTQPNRRHFELHPGNFNQRIYDRPLLPSHLFNRNTIGANALLVEPQRFEENMKVTATNGNLDGANSGSKNVDFENGDGKLISAQSIVESQKEIPKVEPVTTLQQIQHQRLLQKTGGIVATNGLSGRNATATAINADANGKTEKPLYVVYPMQKQPIQRGNGETVTILADQIHKPATIQHQPQQQQQQLGLPYILEKNKSRYILNSRPAYEFEKKSEQQQDPIAAETDEEDR